jgi:hypothetical protein
MCTYTTSAMFRWENQFLCQIPRFQPQYSVHEYRHCSAGITLSFLSCLPRSVFPFCLFRSVFPVVPFCLSYSACPVLSFLFCLSRSVFPVFCPNSKVVLLVKGAVLWQFLLLLVLSLCNCTVLWLYCLLMYRLGDVLLYDVFVLCGTVK